MTDSDGEELVSGTNLEILADGGKLICDESVTLKIKLIL
jgi:hypothetical protein